MPGLRCLVIDDQTETRAVLARMLGADPSVARVITANDTPGALRVLRDADVDVAFIEAYLPDMDGIDLAWILKKLRAAPAVVFVTRDPGRAAEAFEVGAVDYVTKPPRPERLAESLRRVAVSRGTAGIAYAGQPDPAVPATSGSAVPPAALDGRLAVTLGATTKLVPYKAVRWVQARGDYARIHASDGSYLIRAAMADLSDRLRSVGLVRIHRSYLVQLAQIAEVRMAPSGAMTVLVDGHHLPVSRRMAPKLRAELARLRLRTVDPNGHGQPLAAHPLRRHAGTARPDSCPPGGGTRKVPR